MRYRVFAALLIILTGLALTPLQSQITREELRLKYGGVHVTREIRDQIGQGLAIALLAGFRGLAADFIWIRGHGYWEQKKWLQQAECIENVVKLQPQSTLFWDVGAWHMAWNIGYAERVDTNKSTQAQGIAKERLWHERARVFLERGLENIPNRFDLYFKLGWLYEQKLVRDCGGDAACEQERYAKAAECFTKATTYKEAPVYIQRTAARALEKSGDVTGAYQRWLDIWAKEGLTQDSISKNIIRREIERLENILNIPEKSRAFPPRAPTADEQNTK